MTATATVTAATVTTTGPAPAVLVTCDLDVIDAVKHTPGLPFTLVTGSALQAWPHWADAPVVIVGADALAGCVAFGLPARDLVVVTNDRPADHGAVQFLTTGLDGTDHRADILPAAHAADVLPRVLARTASRHLAAPSAPRW